MSAVEEDPRFLIAASRRILYREGLDSQTGGHVSMRAAGEDAFWMTPRQYFDETRPEHVAKMSFSLDVLESGSLNYPLSASFHAEIYKSRPDVGCVIHTHARNAALMSMRKHRFEMLYFYSCLFKDSVAYFHDGATDDGSLIASALGDNRVLLISHHGVVHAGPTLQDTTVDAILFELCCDLQMSSIASGAEPLDPDTIDRYHNAFERGAFRREIWEANFRRLRLSDQDLFPLGTS